MTLELIKIQSKGQTYYAVWAGAKLIKSTTSLDEAMRQFELTKANPPKEEKQVPSETLLSVEL